MLVKLFEQEQVDPYIKVLCWIRHYDHDPNFDTYEAYNEGMFWECKNGHKLHSHSSAGCLVQQSFVMENS